MARLRLATAGESHGPGLTVIVEGLPADVPVDDEVIAEDLARRQRGYGRGGRMAIERDRAEIRGGVRHGRTLGGPVALWIENRDFASWREEMAPGPPVPPSGSRPLRRPRPGHADLAGCGKLEIDDARPVLERASARETAARVAGGALARALLGTVGCEIASHVLALGEIEVARPGEVTWEAIRAVDPGSGFRVADRSAEERLRRRIDEAQAEGDTLGGAFEVVAHVPPAGLGHYAQWDLRLDGRLGQALLSIPAAKWVAIGEALDTVRRPGSAAHDPIRAAPAGGIGRPSNRAGGIEGGMTNGQELRVSVGMKPLATLRRPLPSVDLATGEQVEAGTERSDVTVVPAAGVVGEAMVALVLADALLDKHGGDSLGELQRNLRSHAAAIAGLGRPRSG